MTKHLHTEGDEFAVLWVPADPEMKPEIKVVTNHYSSFQRLVGGYATPYPRVMIDLPDLRCGCRLVVMVDEEAHFKQSPRNNTMNAVLNSLGAHQPIQGDAIIIAEGPGNKSAWTMWGLPQYMVEWRGPGYPLPVDENADV